MAKSDPGSVYSRCRFQARLPFCTGSWHTTRKLIYHPIQQEGITLHTHTHTHTHSKSPESRSVETVNCLFHTSTIFWWSLISPKLRRDYGRYRTHVRTHTLCFPAVSCYSGFLRIQQQPSVIVLSIHDTYTLIVKLLDLWWVTVKLRGFGLKTLTDLVQQHSSLVSSWEPAPAPGLCVSLFISTQAIRFPLNWICDARLQIFLLASVSHPSSNHHDHKPQNRTSSSFVIDIYHCYVPLVCVLLLSYVMLHVTVTLCIVPTLWFGMFRLTVLPCYVSVSWCYV